MAMTINSSPVLTGESAQIFFDEAQKKSHLPAPRLSPEREEKLRQFEQASHDFYIHLFGKEA